MPIRRLTVEFQNFPSTLPFHSHRPLALLLAHIPRSLPSNLAQMVLQKNRGDILPTRATSSRGIVVVDCRLADADSRAVVGNGWMVVANREAIVSTEQIE